MDEILNYAVVSIYSNLSFEEGLIQKYFACYAQILSIEHTVDWEIFVLKIIHVKNFCGGKFLRFHFIHKIILTVDSCNRDECLECS